ncbi:MAG: glycosyltransferase family 4 protein [Acidobacteria bacterium]|nr:glycosyltransferase family 4 protein [Acidobacteriota bacterium]
MKIVLATKLFIPIDGSAEGLVNFAISLKELGHSITVVLIFPPATDNQYFRRLQQAGIPVISVTDHPFNTILRIVRRAARLGGGLFRQFLAEDLTGQTLRWILRRLNPDLLHVVRFDSMTRTFIRAGHARRLPVLFHETSTPTYVERTERGETGVIEMLQSCHRIAALSPCVAKQVTEQLGDDVPVSVVPLFSFPPPAAATTNNGNRELVRFGFAARVETKKGVREMIEAFAGLAQQNPNVRLKVVGDGDQKPEIIERAKTLGVAEACEFLPTYVGEEERLRFMHSIDVLLLPSYIEGTPNSIIEAMALSLPVVASAVGGIPDMVSEQSGRLVPAGDARALEQAMAEVAADAELRNQMGKVGRQHYEARYSPQAVVPMLLDAYEKMMAGKSVTQ